MTFKIKCKLPFFSQYSQADENFARKNRSIFIDLPLQAPYFETLNDARVASADQFVPMSGHVEKSETVKKKVQLYGETSIFQFIPLLPWLQDQGLSIIYKYYIFSTSLQNDCCSIGNARGC